jgi:hypothetical protein
MIASICTSLFSADGQYVIELADKSDTDNLSRRVNRTATLDGGAVTVDLGYSDSDRRFALTTQDAATAIAIREKAKTHSKFTLSVKSGAFLCSFDRVTFASGEATLYMMAV